MTAVSRGSRRAIAALLWISVAACGGPELNEQAGALAGAGSASREVNAPAAQTGTVQIGGATYPFSVTRCDPTGEMHDGMVLQGAGTTPDGRRLTVSVDRTGSDMITENAFVSFGTLQDGDNWSASRTGLQDGRWFVDQAATVPADGRLIGTPGDELVVEAIFHREADDSSAPAVLRATCPS